MKSKITLSVNGEKIIAQVDHTMTLLHFLRDQLGLTGTKKSCEGGDCGACTVLFDDKAVNSCLVLAVQANGSNIITIEGLADGDNLHPLQKAFIDEGAVQCGYCTPGMIMSAFSLLKHNNNPTDDEIKEALAGNLCRCTGYTKIISAVKSAAKKLKEDMNNESI